MSSNGSAESIGSTLACLNIVNTLESAAVLTRTQHNGNIKGNKGIVADTGSVRKSCDMGWPAIHDHEYMCLIQFQAKTRISTKGVQMYSNMELIRKCLCFINTDKGLSEALSQTISSWAKYGVSNKINLSGVVTVLLSWSSITGA